ncbi:MAG TPA: hypothetical protein VE933_05815 [Chitinophagaceae bacterium]|nr:hypothetical protein [Chitinophagaceae bacterium]
MTPQPDPPIDMMNVVVPFIKQNREFFSSVDANGDYYKFIGTKSESHFYFVITTKTKFINVRMGTGYYITYLPAGTSTPGDITKLSNIPIIKTHLDHWLSLIKQHRSHFEEDVQIQPAILPQSQDAESASWAVENFESLMVWAELENHVPKYIKFDPKLWREMYILLTEFQGERFLTRELFLDFMNNDKSLSVRKNMFPSEIKWHDWKSIKTYPKKFWIWYNEKPSHMAITGACIALVGIIVAIIVALTRK